MNIDHWIVVGAFRLPVSRGHFRQYECNVFGSFVRHSDKTTLKALVHEKLEEAQMLQNQRRLQHGLN